MTEQFFTNLLLCFMCIMCSHVCGHTYAGIHAHVSIYVWRSEFDVK